MGYHHLGESLAALLLLNLFMPQDPPKPDPNDFKVTKQALVIWESDGSHCRKFVITNVDTNANSNQSVTLRWSDGNSHATTLKPGDAAIEKECKITSVTVRETALDTSTIRCVQN